MIAAAVLLTDGGHQFVVPVSSRRVHVLCSSLLKVQLSLSPVGFNSLKFIISHVVLTICSALSSLTLFNIQNTTYTN